jgi:hypothetical protein
VTVPLVLKIGLGSNAATRRAKTDRYTRTAVMRGLSEAGDWSLTTMVRNRWVPTNSGTLRQSIRKTLRARTLTMLLSTPLKYALPVEKGRKPGRRPPPIAPILQWVQRKRIEARTQKGGKPIEPRELAFIIAQRIGSKGIPAANFFKRTAKALQPRLAGFIRRATRGR